MGNVVSVLSPEHDAHFRGKIIKRLNDGTYDVFYIDFGNIENVPSEVIYELDETLKVPFLFFSLFELFILDVFSKKDYNLTFLYIYYLNGFILLNSFIS